MKKPSLENMDFWFFLFSIGGPFVAILGFYAEWFLPAALGTVVTLGACAFKFIFYRCPDCSKHLSSSRDRFCPHCGKQIREKT